MHLPHHITLTWHRLRPLLAFWELELKQLLLYHILLEGFSTGLFKLRKLFKKKMCNVSRTSQFFYKIRNIAVVNVSTILRA